MSRDRATALLHRALFESSAWGIFVTDGDGVIQSFNAAAEAWSGYKAEQLVGRATPALLHDGDEVAARARELERDTGAPLDPGFEVLVAGARRGAPEEREWTWVRRDGTRMPVLVSFNPLRNADGEICGFLGIATDLTGRERVRDELTQAKEVAERANRAKSEFLANMSHELRTPLNSIIGFANILLKNKHEHLDAKELNYLTRVLDNGKHLLGLINTILDLTKIEVGKSELHLTPVRLDSLICEVVAQFESQVQDRDLKLIADVPADVAVVDLDEQKMRQVLINLVGNACKFTERGSVTVALEVDPVNRRPLTISVVDTGVGIPPERQQAVFEAFQQADNTTARKFGGTGLGLTITRTLLEHMHFRIELESEVGMGSIFRVSLWRREKEARAGDVLTAAEARRLRVSEKLVLIVGPDADARREMNRIVQEVGCRVVSAPSAAWGLELAQLNQPDIVIVDLDLPSEGGAEVVNRLRAEAALAETPVVAVSPLPDEARGTLAGVEDFVAKPVESEDLKIALSRHLFPKRGKILVVDDETFVTEVLSYALQDKGAEVRTAVHGQDALEVLRSYQPDVILLDLTMPVMDGMSFLAAFERHPRFAKTPVFVLTGKILTPQEISETGRLGVRVMIKGERLDVLLREVFARLPERRTRTRPRRTVVRVMRKLAHLIPGFLRNRRNDVEAIRGALASGDYALIQRLGHQLRGAGGGYGFTDLTDIGHRLEMAAGSTDTAEMQHALGALMQYLDSVEVVYQ